MGLITLIYKGGGKQRSDPASYRPITLLNCDLKIVAKVLARRFGPALESIIDGTQTAFVPGRDIADNVLLHLEEIDYVEETVLEQGCIAEQPRRAAGARWPVCQAVSHPVRRRCRCLPGMTRPRFPWNRFRLT